MPDSEGHHSKFIRSGIHGHHLGRMLAVEPENARCFGGLPAERLGTRGRCAGRLRDQQIYGLEAHDAVSSVFATRNLQNAIGIEKGLNQFGTPMSWAAFEGVPMRRVDQILNTEARVV